MKYLIVLDEKEFLLVTSAIEILKESSSPESFVHRAATALHDRLLKFSALLRDEVASRESFS